MKARNLILMMAGTALLAGCSKSGWRVDGTIANAPEGAKLSVEGFNAGIWYNIDSVDIAPSGAFSYVSPEGAPYPDIYRVSLNGRSIYFPIDSLEAINIQADAEAFDTDYTVSGWEAADEMHRIDRLIADAVAAKGADAALNDSVLKRELSIAINDDQSGILGYYIINKTIGGVPLFSAASRSDLRMIGALANKFAIKYPNDPRTAYLAERFMRGRADLNPSLVPGTVMEANETGMLEIELYDAKGTRQKLSDLAAKSGITLLSFTSNDLDTSVAYNVELNRLYEMFKPYNIGIYQVAIDNNEVQWRTIANNLPWTSVWYDQKDGGRLVRMYNVVTLPVTYIIDRNGDLVDRIDDPAQLEANIRKHI